MTDNDSPSTLLDHALTEGDAIGRLRSIAALAVELNTLTGETVAAARREGASWAAIGSALGVTRQGARQRFAPEGVCDPEVPADAGSPATKQVDRPATRATEKAWDVRLLGGWRVATVEPRSRK